MINLYDYVNILHLCLIQSFTTAKPRTIYGLLGEEKELLVQHFKK